MAAAIANSDSDWRCSARKADLPSRQRQVVLLYAVAGPGECLRHMPSLPQLAASPTGRARYIGRSLRRLAIAVAMLVGPAGLAANRRYSGKTSRYSISSFIKEPQTLETGYMTTEVQPLHPSYPRRIV